MDSKMIKQAVLLLILSIIAMFMQDQLAHVLRFMLHLHNIVAGVVGKLTSHFGTVGVVIQSIVSLVLIPVVFGLIVSALFWLVKHMSMPNMMSVIWIVWMIMLVAILAQGSRV